MFDLMEVNYVPWQLNGSNLPMLCPKSQRKKCDGNKHYNPKAKGETKYGKCSIN